MSILLDALKKSEAQRRLGEIPTLQTHVSLDEGRGGERHAWLPFALVLLSAAIMSWTGIAQFRLDDSDAGSNRQANDSSVAEVAKSESAKAPTAGAESETRSAGTRARAKNSAATPVQDYVAETPPGPSRANPQSAGRTAAASRASRKPAGIAAARRTEASEASRSVAHVEVEANEGSAAADAVNSDQDTNTDAGAAAVTDQGSYAPQTISYWQMPQALREELGEMRISVLVYAANPQDRFLLVNGSRVREQQQTESGAVLEEIQRDRAVFTYRNYRFHVTN